MEYRSALAPLGVPLVHVAIGGPRGRGIARGWIAIGDVAFGVVAALGGLAVGGVALGGLGVGAIALGGLAVGGLATGGLAVGVLAVGGGAIGLVGALGGLAVARDVAVGGVAIAAHANDAVARELVAHGGYFDAGRSFLGWSRVLLVLPPTIVAVRWLAQRSRAREAGS
jgi:hypothetical protein